jgi:hypothetical protein
MVRGKSSGSPCRNCFITCRINSGGRYHYEDAWQIERGYENLLQKIKELGGS